MLVVGFPTGPLQANCYLLAAAPGGPCVVVDPGEGGEPLAQALAGHGLTPVVVLATHGHPDHLAADLGVPVRLHPADAALHDGPSEPLTEGTHTFAGLVITVTELPGHTPGSVAFGVTTEEGGRLVLTGDTLFAGSIGRSGDDTEAVARVVRERLLTLPEDTVVLPGHGPATTIGRERAANPAVSGVRG